MLNMFEVNETNNMIEHEKLDVRTITMGISLLDCCDANLDELNRKIYEKITSYAKDLVKTGEEIARDFGVPIVNKRISVTPIALVGGCACKICDKVDTFSSLGHSPILSVESSPSEGEAVCQYLSCLCPLCRSRNRKTFVFEPAYALEDGFEVLAFV